MIFFQPRVTRKTLTTFDDLGDLFSTVIEGALQPQRRLTVSEWAEAERYINQPGAYVGPWRNGTVPYMVEPMEIITDPNFSGEIFVGPAQCAKTDALIINTIGYSATTDPMDMIVYSPTTTAARDFSIRRVDRLHRHSKSVGAAMLKDRDADNRTDKQYANGMMLSLSHPSVAELAGRPIGRVFLTDYDRMPDDIDGEGSPYDLASKRTTTFGSFAMAVAESSPSRDVTDPKYVCSGNEAPPCGGILALYNRGDRRRWHWPCPDCGSYFEGLWEHLAFDKLESNMDSALTVRMICPHCNYAISPDQRTQMNLDGVWLKDGEFIDADGMIAGKGMRSNIASFWLRGVAAGLTTWAKLVKSYLDAEDDFQANGSEESLKKFFNTDLGEPYISKRDLADKTRTFEMVMEKAYGLPYLEDEDHEDVSVLRITNNQSPKYIEPLVPEHVRALIGLVDVQQNMFIVQIVGISPGKPYDLTVVDRFQIRNSIRPDEHSGGFEWVKPGSYLYDWDKIDELVIRRAYRLATDPSRKMTLKMTFCDSGGKAGVTSNAYAFVRELRKRGVAGRFHLVKGDATPKAPRTRITYPDNSKRGGGAKAGAQGDVPVLLLNPGLLKDTLDNRLDVAVPGFGMLHFPDWLPDWFFQELVSEIRDQKKGWINPNKRRNEAWDLLYYAIGACVSAALNIEKVDWENPPLWLAPQEGNPLVIAAEREESIEPATRIDFSHFGRALA
jgi:phage terminase large subunit GpA-like protein